MDESKTKQADSADLEWVRQECLRRGVPPEHVRKFAFAMADMAIDKDDDRDDQIAHLVRIFESVPGHVAVFPYRDGQPGHFCLVADSEPALKEIVKRLSDFLTPQN